MESISLHVENSTGRMEVKNTGEGLMIFKVFQFNSGEDGTRANLVLELTDVEYPPEEDEK